MDKFTCHIVIEAYDRDHYRQYINEGIRQLAQTWEYGINKGQYTEESSFGRITVYRDCAIDPLVPPKNTPNSSKKGPESHENPKADE